MTKPPLFHIRPSSSCFMFSVANRASVTVVMQKFLTPKLIRLQFRGTSDLFLVSNVSAHVPCLAGPQFSLRNCSRSSSHFLEGVTLATLSVAEFKDFCSSESQSVHKISWVTVRWGTLFECEASSPSTHFCATFEWAHLWSIKSFILLSIRSLSSGE